LPLNEFSFVNTIETELLGLLQLSIKETTNLTKADFKQDRGTTQAKV
jgi:hypothetical protein